jgi:uncharacterized protein YdiU (UPF0061 family)
MTDHIALAHRGWNLDNSYAQLPGSMYTRINLNPVQSPKLMILNEKLATSLGLNAEALRSHEGVAELAGNEVPDGGQPLAQAYAGHQFGHLNLLGDGRALLLGEQITPQGERVDIQLKGSGRTPYSRGGDGRAGVGPMLREYMISEAMHALGIPTTRSLAVVSTGEPVYRETELSGAILTRIAASHIRVGTFQYAAGWGKIEDVQALADYTLQRHYPDIEVDEHRYLHLLQEVIKRQAKLIAQWQLVGFIHGVMNTDNMAISGETIDYGPCAFMDVYNPATVFSSIDRHGRYAYANQPYIAAWNLARFAETLLPLLHEDGNQAIKLAEDAISQFSKLYEQQWLAGMRSKLGLFNEEEQDGLLIEGLLNLMQQYEADYTNTFRALTLGKQLEGSILFETTEFAKWHEQWRARLSKQEPSTASAEQLMRSSNPAVIPRNHRVEEALEAAVNEGDLSVMERLNAALSNPFAYAMDHDEYTAATRSTRPYVTYCGT